MPEIKHRVKKKVHKPEPEILEVKKSAEQCVKFIRLGEGTYTFGTKRISVRIINGKLVIRVGGGYMMIQEFLRLYTL